MSDDGSRASPGSTRFGIKFASHYTPVEDIARLAQRAEALGYHSVWTTEGPMWPDSITTASAIAAVTERVRVGTSVVNPFSRTPALLATSSASIDRLSGGRFVLGIGAGDRVTLLQQNIAYDRPLARLRECVHVIRRLWAGERTTFHGETLRVENLGMNFRPRQERIPIYVAGTGPRAIAQANEIADGILLTVCIPRAVVEKVVAIADQPWVKVIGNVVVGMDADTELAIKGMKPHFVRYFTRFPAIPRAAGVDPDLVNRITAAATHDPAAASELVPDELVTELAAVGTPDQCREWITAYTHGLDEALLMPAHGDPRVMMESLAGLHHDAAGS